MAKSKNSSSDPLRVLFLAAEADPFIKVGGLGDVAGALPKAVRACGIDIRLVIPFHGAIHRNSYDIQPVASFTIPHTDGVIPAEVFVTEINDLPVYLISGPPISPEAPVYSRDGGFDAHKYTFFSLAALELARALRWTPHVVHANDWHTAPAVYSLGLHRSYDPFFRKTATLLGIHNLPFLGVGASIPLGAFNLPPAPGTALPEWARHLPLPLALLTADHIVAVSPTYAQEILTAEFGSGLQDFLTTRSADISGILNGIDLEVWNPEIDPRLEANYSLANLPARGANRSALIEEFGLDPDPSIPLLAMITRLDYQKGIDLALDALQLILDRPWQIIILGTGLAELEQAARLLAKNHPDRVRTAIRFDAALSRRIYAGADALLMPSRYEPCGLAQMNAMRYGCVPVARATGGLRDTIIDAGEETMVPPVAAATGFLFTEANASALALVLQRMLKTFANRKRWELLQQNGMRQDFSWTKAARQYADLYQKLITQRKKRAL